MRLTPYYKANKCVCVCNNICKTSLQVSCSSSFLIHTYIQLFAYFTFAENIVAIFFPQHSFTPYTILKQINIQLCIRVHKYILLYNEHINVSIQHVFLLGRCIVSVHKFFRKRHQLSYVEVIVVSRVKKYLVLKSRFEKKNQ